MANWFPILFRLIYISLIEAFRASLSLLLFPSSLQEESQTKGGSQTGAPENVADGLDVGLAEALGKVKDEVADAVDGVADKGPGEQELEGALGGDGEGAKGGGDGGRLEVPAQQGSDEVGGAKDVQAAGEDAAGDTRPDGAGEEGLAGVVDLQMRCYGSAAALGGEEGLGIGLGEFRGGNGSGNRVRRVSANRSWVDKRSSSSARCCGLKGTLT